MTEKKRMEKHTSLILTTLIILVFAVAVLAYLNTGDLDLKKKLEMNAEFQLLYGDFAYLVTMEDVLDLNPIEFGAIMRTSTTQATPVSFTGVELTKLLARYGIPVEAGSTVQINALDGYASVFTAEEVLTPENVFLCIYMNGEVLKPKKAGGFGPYLVVIRNVQFAQRWCKFVEEIVVR